MAAKPFSVGMRIEHLQKDIDKALFGDKAGHPLLGKGEYQLSYRRSDGSAVYTFCMCPGGMVVPSASAKGGIVTNGMSYHDRSCENANAAVVASVDAAVFGPGVLDGAVFQEKIGCR